MINRWETVLFWSREGSKFKGRGKDMKGKTAVFFVVFWCILAVTGIARGAPEWVPPQHRADYSFMEAAALEYASILESSPAIVEARVSDRGHVVLIERRGKLAHEISIKIKDQKIIKTEVKDGEAVITTEQKVPLKQGVKIFGGGFLTGSFMTAILVVFLMIL